MRATGPTSNDAAYEEALMLFSAQRYASTLKLNVSLQESYAQEFRLRRIQEVAVNWLREIWFWLSVAVLIVWMHVMHEGHSHKRRDESVTRTKNDPKGGTHGAH